MTAIHQPQQTETPAKKTKDQQLPVLSVGREIGMEHRQVVCRRCGWEGRGRELSAGLVMIPRLGAYLLAYKCPACGGFELACKGKVLAFPAGGRFNKEPEETTQAPEKR